MTKGNLARHLKKQERNKQLNSYLARQRTKISILAKKSRPMTPQVREEMKLRRELHRLGEKIWGSWRDSFNGDISKVRMYQWMQENTSTGHASSMRLTELKAVINKLKRML
jgi:hypothetical protein